MKVDEKINKIIDNSIKKVLGESIDDEYSYEAINSKIDEILNNIARKNGWWYENDQFKYGRYIELDGSQVFFDVDENGRIYINDIKISGMRDADSSVTDCEELIKLLTIFTKNTLNVK